MLRFSVLESNEVRRGVLWYHVVRSSVVWFVGFVRWLVCWFVVRGLVDCLVRRWSVGAKGFRCASWYAMATNGFC